MRKFVGQINVTAKQESACQFMFLSCTRNATKRVRIEPCAATFITSPSYHHEDRNGRIVCTCTHEDVVLQWKDLDDDAVVSEDGMQIENLLPGTYSCVVALDNVSWASLVTVEDLNVCIVTGYETEDASMDNSRDGRIVALVENVPDDVEYLWTSGVMTKFPVLEDANPGRYSVSMVLKDRMCLYLVNACFVGVKTDPSNIVLQCGAGVLEETDDDIVF